MNEIKTLKIHCLSETLSPLTHMMGVSGNEALINRTKVASGGQIYDVPMLSGNAIRHKMIREPGALFLLSACGLVEEKDGHIVGKLNVDQANFLFYGGSLTESSISDNLKKIAEMQELLPLIRLLGGSLKNQVIAGSLLVSMGSLICEENKETLSKIMPFDLPLLRSCEDYVSSWQYTRGDASKMPELLKDDTELDDKSNLMIYCGQHVIPGAMFYHSFILQKVSRLEAGALYAALQDWQKLGGGIMGGSGRIGHGKMDTDIYVEGSNFFGDEIGLEACASEYREHTRKNADKIVAWLNECFPARAPKATKSKTKKPAGLDDSEKMQMNILAEAQND